MTASTRIAKTVEHPPKLKHTCKRQDQPETEHQADLEALDEPYVPDDLLEDEELVEGEDNAGLAHREPFRNPFEGQPECFRGTSDKFIMTEYQGHIASCVYDDFLSYKFIYFLNCLIL
ncbi:hypothetical protein L195_g000867 [Trifolium pratense]|uniref:Uncharacterized protein n=1 Tax=Trifolium pratense TaxID=57577 RepID=A0A2K3NN30_TRIPR|nr:hypothetical protein L195_g000867 [Trifolium pratense]